MNVITILGFKVYESSFWGIMGLLGGAIITIIITILIESARQPDLRLSIVHAEDVDFKNREGPYKKARFLRVKLTNLSLPWISRWWLQRSTAENCHGFITFYNESFQKIHLDFGDMPLRWTSSPEPMPDILVMEKFPRTAQNTFEFVRKVDPINTVGTITNLARYIYHQSMDVSSGEEGKAIDIAAKYDEQELSYGWSDETYLKGWENPNRKIAKGHYFVRVIVISSGKKIKEWFKLQNDLPSSKFHLCYLTYEERKKIKRFQDEPPKWIEI